MFSLAALVLCNHGRRSESSASEVVGRELASQEGEFSERQWETALDTLNRLFGIKPEDNLKQDTEE